ncbi:MAG: hypothetical protein K5660_05340 [Paludibacteraceae bacterium]|nr:hypothetical protein [Paludibacteraceae bacterium]
MYIRITAFRGKTTAHFNIGRDYTDGNENIVLPLRILIEFATIQNYYEREKNNNKMHTFVAICQKNLAV